MGTMIAVRSFVRVGEALVAVEDFEGPVADVDYIEGSIELIVGDHPVLTRDLVDYVDHLWGYLVDGLEEVSDGRAFTASFPDMPVRISLAPANGRVEIRVARRHAVLDAVADRAELLVAMVGAATVFFEKMSRCCPANRSIYQAYLRRLGAPRLAAAPVAGPQVLDTFAPTAEQVQAWACDPGLRFAEQDEDLAVSRPEYLAQLVALAADPRVPKRELITRLVDRIATMPRSDLIETMTRARDLARATGDPGLVAWADTLDRVITHASGSGPIDVDRARALAHIVMIGRRRPTVVLDESRHGDWWQFRARFPEAGARMLDSLYVHAATGALAWSWEPLSPDQLARIPTDPRMASFTGALP